MAKKGNKSDDLDVSIDLIGADRVPSTLRGINHMIDGGYILGGLYNIYGEPAAGKTILAYQEAFGDCKHFKEHDGEDKAILYFDTEGLGRGVLESWYPTFSKRFGVKPNIVYRKLTDLMEILQFFGYPMKVDVSNKGKVMLRPDGFDIPLGGKKKKTVIYNRNPPIRELCIKHNVGTIIIDSITEPVDAMFAGGQVQFPTRADAVNAWFGRIHWLAEPSTLTSSGEHERRIVRCILHESVDPSKDKDIWKGITKGGHNVKYKFKVVLYIYPSNKRGFDHVKRIYLARYFNKKGWQERAIEILTDDGYVDPTKKQAEQMYKDSKLFKHEKVVFGNGE